MLSSFGFPGLIITTLVLILVIFLLRKLFKKFKVNNHENIKSK